MSASSPLVGIVMGSASDWPTLRHAAYGKSGARPGPKMGHLTVGVATVEAAERRAIAARAAVPRQEEEAPCTGI